MCDSRDSTRAGSRRGLVVSLSGLLLLALAIAVIHRGGTPFALDATWHRWAVAHRGPGRSDAAVALTDTGTGPCAYGLAAVGGAVAVGRRRRWWLSGVIGAAALLAGQLLRTSLATAIGRSRPPAADWISHPSGYAFPSGHTTSSALVAAGLGAALYLRARSPAGRVAAIVVPGGWAAAVGISRIYLGVHWPTDVLAGWLLAAVLAGSCLPLLGTLLAQPAISGSEK